MASVVVVGTPSLRLGLMGGFVVRRDDIDVPTPPAVQRLLAFLALHGRALPRHFIAGSLWRDVPEARANANLRATIWRMPADIDAVIDVTTTHISLGQKVAVDHHEALGRARALLFARSWAPCPGSDPPCVEADELARELLPGWHDEWVVIERERLRQLRLHALERLCDRLVERGDTAQAIDVGLTTIAAAPLRESAQRALMRAHLAEGNHDEAGRVLDRFRALLREELGIHPSALIEAMVPDGCAAR